MRSHRLAGLIPPMTDDEYVELREDIREHGLRAPIVIFDGKVLDGRHRLRACRELKIEPETIEFSGDDPVSFVTSMNLIRRNLTPSQAAMVGAKILPELTKEAQKRAANGGRRGRDTRYGPGPDGPTPDLQGERATEAAAGMVGSSPRSIRRAKRVLDEDPKLADQVATGEMTVTRADKLIRGTVTPVWPEPGSVKDPGPRVECPTCGHMCAPGDIRTWQE
jgi:ParB/Sulfiredoxin domain